jgi:hypothetical protein
MLAERLQTKPISDVAGGLELGHAPRAARTRLATDRARRPAVSDRRSAFAGLG